MSTAYQSVVCAGIVPGSLQTIEAAASLENPARMTVAFRAGTGGLHSAEN